VGKESCPQLPRRPAATGICHQVNLEHLAPVVFTRKDRSGALAYPTPSWGPTPHAMINGWGVGGRGRIEAEAAMLGQPISMLIPEVWGSR